MTTFTIEYTTGRVHMYGFKRSATAGTRHRPHVSLDKERSRFRTNEIRDKKASDNNRSASVTLMNEETHEKGKWTVRTIYLIGFMVSRRSINNTQTVSELSCRTCGYVFVVV